MEFSFFKTKQINLEMFDLVRDTSVDKLKFMATNKKGIGILKLFV